MKHKREIQKSNSEFNIDYLRVGENLSCFDDTMLMLSCLCWLL